MDKVTDLIEILKLEIPSAEPRAIGFLEIAGIAHHENVNSRIYAYFLDQLNYPELANLFLKSILDIVLEKLDKEISFESYDVITEQSTPAGNRIDIVIKDENNRRALLIENKIYHYLDNDLLEYWNCFGYADDDQIGVLLTLYPHEIPNEVENKFVNITHIEWVNRIQSSGLPSKLPITVYTYLNDFFSTMENLTNTSTMTEQAQFYFENAKTVQMARRTYNEGVKYVNDQLAILASLMNWNLYGRADDWRNIWDEKNKLHTYYTIWSGDLLNGEKTITVIIELNTNDFHHLPKMNEILDEKLKSHALEKGGQKFKYTQHFAHKVYTVNQQDLADLANFLLKRIQEDFEPLMKLILKNNYPNIEIPFIDKDQY